LKLATRPLTDSPAAVPVTAMQRDRFMTIGRAPCSKAARRSLRLAASVLAVAAAFVVPAPASAAVLKMFALPPSLKSPDMIVLGPDGALWFTQVDSNDKRKASVLGRITTAGETRVVAIPKGSRPRALAAGPDGALWYAAEEADVGRLGRVTPTGVEELLLPRAPGGQSANGIVTGADGALWFTNGGRIGRLVPGAAPTFIPIRDAESSLQQIIADPNGALWFTQEDTIRRITPTGTLSTFRLPPAIRHVRDIAVAADGALWFTDYDDARIGRIAPDGHIRLYDLPNLNQPGAITVGPDAAIWFIGLTTIGRITASGEVTEIPIPDPLTTFGQDLTSGPDGALWFTKQIHTSDGSEIRSGKIGRIALADGQLLTARLTTDAVRARRGRLLRISFTSTRSASGFVQLDHAGRTFYLPAAKRAIHAHAGANSVTLRLPRHPDSYRLLLRLHLGTQVASDTARVTITR
jgi:virginiamycin B lyase